MRDCTEYKYNEVAQLYCEKENEIYARGRQEGVVTGIACIGVLMCCAIVLYHVYRYFRNARELKEFVNDLDNKSRTRGSKS